MTKHTFLPDDPKLTAYALGELEGDERTAMEVLLRDNAAARAVVEEIRATASQLTSALAAEAEPELSAPIEFPGARGGSSVLGPGPREVGYGSSVEGKKVLRFPQLYYIIGLGAVACFAVVVALRGPLPQQNLPPLAEGGTVDQPAAAENLSSSIAATEAATATAPGVDVSVDPSELLKEVATVAEIRPEALPQLDETMPAPQSDLTLLGQVKTSENFGEIRNRMELDAMKEAVAASEVPAKEREPIRFSSNPDENIPAVILVGKVVVAATPPNQIVPSSSVMMHAPKASPMETAQTLALYDRNKNGRLDPNEIAAMRSQKIAYVAPSKPGTTVPVPTFPIGTTKEKTAFRSSNLPLVERTAAGERFLGSAASSGNEFLPAGSNPLSTFPIEIGTASYTEVRRFLQAGTLPPHEAVRVEELINAFSYRYAAAKDDAPFAVSLEVASAPWAPEHRLVRIGLRGRDVATTNRAASVVIAKDLKIQVEFNPATVASYRLIGYENRRLENESVNPDQADAADLNAGHIVTTLYEVVPVGLGKPLVGDPPTFEGLKYQAPKPAVARLSALGVDPISKELLTVKVRYKKPDGILSRKVEFALSDENVAFANASADFKFAAAVAGFGMILCDSPRKGSATLSDVLTWAEPTSDDNLRGERVEFITLVSLAKSLTPRDADYGTSHSRGGGRPARITK
jgi:hypothetical protein